MAEPVRKTPAPEVWTQDHEVPEEENSGIDVVQRWVERPDGSMELLELPLTPELFLNTQLDDKMIQGFLHYQAAARLHELLDRYFHSDPETIVTTDLQYLLGTAKPAPDVAVIRGLAHFDIGMESYDLRKMKVPPSLIIEVVSRSSPRIRRVDEVDKVKLYQRTGVAEYLMLDLPRRANRNRFRLKGLRLDAGGRYRPLVPDAAGRLVSETTGLAFAISPDGDGFHIFEVATGRRLLMPLEEEEARKAAEERAEQEAAARKAAEEEIARLRAEIERLKK